MMKKVLSLMAVLMVAGLAHANYWNVHWALLDALSPLDLDGDNSPTLLADYSITWKLVYGDNVTVDWAGNLSGATDITGAIATATKGDSTIGWNDSANGGAVALYDASLSQLSDSLTFCGSTTETSQQSVYQYIKLVGSGENDEWFWLSNPVAVTPVAETSAPVVDLGSELEIGHPNSTSSFKTDNWTKVPEPATMSLLGLGALAVLVRRKLRK